jgi:transposase-like protein
MQPNSRRRVYGAEFKAQVLAECQQPGVSVAAVALSHGLNVNLVRKWLVGRGLKRAGLTAPRTVMRPMPGEPASAAPPAQPLQFLPLELASTSAAQRTAASCDQALSATDPAIRVELHRGGTQLTVRWPASHADACAAWLRELAIAASKP